VSVPPSYGQGTRMLTLGELCEWLNITERHARKLVERNAIPYRKVGRLLRFPEAEVEEWSRPIRKPCQTQSVDNPQHPRLKKRRASSRPALPKSLIE
jgi:excisionase family DNA binding protein